MKKLNRHQEVASGNKQNWKSHQYEVSVDFKQGKNLEINFEVKSKNAYLTSNDFGPDYKKNWGLWNYDVVEAFLQKRDKRGVASPYLEFQLSPKGQAFALVIIKPRQIYYTPLDFKISSKSVVSGESWKAQLSIPSNVFLCEGELYGNFYACLGENQNREYYGMNLNPEEKPDFHRPEFFVKL
ncbi:MAG: hypothetical protein JNM93_11055 [Bacteriovoracaceae bacterium]|nr:hypothetical protein [Bacteriovoracaceae bacterium]